MVTARLLPLVKVYEEEDDWQQLRGAMQCGDGVAIGQHV